MWDLFDLVVCVVVDNETLRDRLLTRSTNAFGKHPEELAAALEHNDCVESICRRLGATIIVVQSHRSVSREWGIRRPKTQFLHCVSLEPAVGNPAEHARAQRWQAMLDGLRRATRAAARCDLPLAGPISAWAEWVIPIGRLPFPAGPDRQRAGPATPSGVNSA